MLNEAVVTMINDPSNAADEALDTAVQAAKGEVEDVRATVSGAIPPLGGSVSDITYKTCYPISHGLFFPTVLVARVIPRENAAVHGFIDGVRATIDLADRMRARSVSGYEAPPIPLPTIHLLSPDHLALEREASKSCQYQ